MPDLHFIQSETVSYPSLKGLDGRRMAERDARSAASEATIGARGGGGTSNQHSRLLSTLVPSTNVT